ncbi:hypothetical protein GGR57DRAFT_503011 [Xylariaceae sp. FL1272]|nr:hypothetical protein GGR57DRAFT_503011 [Xylariaceae sp. FL1272]
MESAAYITQGSDRINKLLPYELHLEIFKQLSDLRSVHALAATSTQFRAILVSAKTTIWTAVGHNVAAKITNDALGEPCLEVATFGLAIWSYRYLSWSSTAAELSHLSGERAFTELDVAVMEQILGFHLPEFKDCAEPASAVMNSARVRSHLIEDGGATQVRNARLDHIKFLMYAHLACCTFDIRVRGGHERKQFSDGLPHPQAHILWDYAFWISHNISWEMHEWEMYELSARNTQLLKLAATRGQRRERRLKRRRYPAQMEIMRGTHEGLTMWRSVLFRSN